MRKPREIGPGIFIIAGPDLTDGRDALGYLIEDNGELALIDAGAGPSYLRIVDNIRAAGYGPDQLRYLIATHAHIDHIGSFAEFVRDYSPIIIAHELDAQALEAGDPVRTAATWYGLPAPVVRVNQMIIGPEEGIRLGRSDLRCIHTPGHTPGSMVVVLDRDGLRYLFGQDIHGPFHSDFGSNVDVWRESMGRLLDLRADVLAEGHYGIFQGRDEVDGFIREQVERISG